MHKSSTYSLNLILILTLVGELIFWVTGLSIWLYLKENVAEFRMEHEWILKYLFLLPVFSALYVLIILRENKRWKQFGDATSTRLLTPISSFKNFIRFYLFRLALGMMIIALGNPQYGLNKKEAISEGIDIMIGLDVSNSMLAEDMTGNLSRLKIAKLSIEKLMSKLHGDRIGLVVFAGSAYTQLPITTDYSAAKLFLSGVSTNMMSSQGTAIGSAIDTCLRAFNYEEESTKAIIIISDGENHEDDALLAAQAAKEKGVLVNTIGVGSENGGPIPEFKNGVKAGIKRDQEGNTVITKMNESMMKEIAEAGGGHYVRASGSDLGLESLIRELNTLEKTEYGTEIYADYEDQFQVFVGIAMLLLIIQQLISEKKSAWLEKLISGK